MIEIRQARTNELDEMLSVMTSAFGVQKELWTPGFYAYPHDDVRNKQIVVADRKIVSCLEFIPAEIYLDGSTVTMAGIAGVATLPDERKHGYAGMLMEHSIHAMHDLGYATSALYPFSYRWYRKYGWEIASQYLLYSIEPKYLPPYREADCVRPYRAEDLPEIMRIYNERYSAHVGPFVRTDREWTEHLLPRFKDVQVYDENGIKGYMISRIEDAEDGNHLQLKEIVTSTEECRRGLIGKLARLAQDITMIEFTTSEFDLHDLGLINPRADWEDGYQSRCSIKLRPGFMFRIIDLKSAMQALVRRISRFNGELSIRTQDDIGTWNNNPVVVRGVQSPEVVDGDSTDWLRADIRTLSQFYVGFMSPREALSLGKLEVSGPEALESAEILFPATEPFIPEPNEF